MSMISMSESKFFMWRSLVALVHADHVVTTEERAFFETRFKNRRLFTEEQKKQLLNDLDDEKSVHDLFENVTDKEDRATLIYLARLLFWSDGEFAEQEELILNKLKVSTLNKIDIHKAMKGVEKQVQDTMDQYDKEKDAIGKETNWIMSLMDIFDDD